MFPSMAPDVAQSAQESAKQHHLLLRLSGQNQLLPKVQELLALRHTTWRFPTYSNVMGVTPNHPSHG
jgi:hypothetical protein